MKKKPELNPVTEAMKVLQAENQKRVMACQKEIAEVLQRHGCMLIPQITVASK